VISNRFVVRLYASQLFSKMQRMPKSAIKMVSAFEIHFYQDKNVASQHFYQDKLIFTGMLSVNSEIENHYKRN
jgi:hypothetical protein